MRGNHSVRITRAGIDFAVVILAFEFAYHVRSWALAAGLLSANALSFPRYVLLAVVFGIVCVLVFWWMGLYQEHASVLNLREYQTAVKGIFLAAALFFALLFLFEVPRTSRFVVVGGIVVAAVFVVLARRMVSAIVRQMKLGDQIGRRILIYGCGETGRLLMKKLLQSPHRNSKVVGFVDDFAPRGSTISCSIDQTTPYEVFEARVLGRLGDLPALVEKYEVDELLVTVPLTSAERHHETLQFARELSIDVGVVPRLGELRADLLEIEDLSAIPVLRPSSIRPQRLAKFGKRVLDLIVSLTLLVLTLPVWVTAAVLIRLDSPGPILFKQRRIGLGGRTIWIYKFRTMRHDVDPYSRSPIGDLNDPRITRIGRMLRMGGVDELPQALNVLKGEMSMVGPRPEMPFIVDQYTPLEKERLTVKPGITGLWQLSSDRHAEIHENIEYDLYYVRNHSLLMDALILFETLFFTIGLMPRATSRSRIVPKKVPSMVREGPISAVPGYVVAALDQRVTGNLPESWITCVPALYALAVKWDVKILVAPDNVRTFDDLIDRPALDGSNGTPRTEYIPYMSRSELRAATLSARLVITDLDHVAQWAREAKVDVLILNGARVRWEKGSSGAEELVEEFLSNLQRFSPLDGIGERAVAAGEAEPL